MKRAAFMSTAALATTMLAGMPAGAAEPDGSDVPIETTAHDPECDGAQGVAAVSGHPCTRWLVPFPYESELFKGSTEPPHGVTPATRLSPGAAPPPVGTVTEAVWVRFLPDVYVRYTPAEAVPEVEDCLGIGGVSVSFRGDAAGGSCHRHLVPFPMKDVYLLQPGQRQPPNALPAVSLGQGVPAPMLWDNPYVDSTVYQDAWGDGSHVSVYVADDEPMLKAPGLTPEPAPTTAPPLPPTAPAPPVPEPAPAPLPSGPSTNPPTPSLGPVPDFPDAADSVHAHSIAEVAAAGITSGYPDGTFRPHAGVTRGQMATFLARALELELVEDGSFSDTAGSVHEPSINAVALAGITRGDAAGNFDPSRLVTRGQMATFLARALALPAPPSPPGLTDVTGSVHADAIAKVTAAGISSGYPDATFRPAEDVTRGQMASFLARALRL